METAGLPQATRKKMDPFLLHPALHSLPRWSSAPFLMGSDPYPKVVFQNHTDPPMEGARMPGLNLQRNGWVLKGRGMLRQAFW